MRFQIVFVDGLEVIPAVLLRSAGLSDFALFCRAEALDFGPFATIRRNEPCKQVGRKRGPERTSFRLSMLSSGTTKPGRLTPLNIDAFLRVNGPILLSASFTPEEDK